MRRTLIAAAISAAMLLPGLGFAKTFKWTSQGDILTLDPHSQNEGLTSQPTCGSTIRWSNTTKNMKWSHR